MVVRDFDVSGMTCGSCAARVQRTLGRQDGVVDAAVNFATARATVRFNPETVGPDQLAAVVHRTGYELAPHPDPVEAAAQVERAEEAEQRNWLRRIVVATPLTVAIVALTYW